MYNSYVFVISATVVMQSCAPNYSVSCIMFVFCSLAVTAAAARVAERCDHAVSSRKLSTVLVASWPKSTSCVVHVTGFANGTSVDTILRFFENRRRSRGGAVMELCYDEQEASAVVTFHNRDG